MGVTADELGTYGKQVEQKEVSQEALSRLLLEIIDLIPVAFFVKDHKSCFFLMNRACEAQWGLSFAEVRGNDAGRFFPPEQLQQFLATDRAIFEGRVPVEFEETFWSAAKQSNRIGHTFKRPMYDVNGDPQYLVCVTIDVTEQKQAQAALADSERDLRAQATTDGLTDLPNRRQFFARLTDEFARFQRLVSTPSSVLMLDLDFFKQVNDRYGHAGGDAVLRHFGHLMCETMRKIDTAGRVGGEEFAIILPGTSAAGARAFAERLRTVVANEPVIHHGETIQVTASIGIATMDGRDANAEAALARSDKALYLAKRNGRNRVELAETDI